jgi:hypothetical protein
MKVNELQLINFANFMVDMHQCISYLHLDAARVVIDFVSDK